MDAQIEKCMYGYRQIEKEEKKESKLAVWVEKAYWVTMRRDYR